MQGTKGKKGVQGIMGLPGRHGKQGIMGNQGMKGKKGEKGKLLERADHESICLLLLIELSYFKSLTPGAYNSHTKPMPRHFCITVYF